MTKTARIGIVTVSDRASRGEYQDRGGPAILDYLAEVLSSEWESCRRVISDDQPVVERTLMELCEQEQCCLVVTTGGTGPALRDITPEATEAVCQKMMPGFGELMRQVSLQYVPTAILSRQIGRVMLAVGFTNRGDDLASASIPTVKSGTRDFRASTSAASARRTSASMAFSLGFFARAVASI